MTRIFILTAVTMVAFAANSLLNRAALADGAMGPAAFQAIRLISGALMLVALAGLRGGLPIAFDRRRVVGAGSLLLYVVGFSFAYVALDAGAGALLLFGGVQLTMFAGAVVGGEAPARARWLGSGIAFVGLVWLLWPSAVEPLPLGGSLMMVAAALGWGIYSLAGRGAVDPLAETAANFLYAAPIALLIWVLISDEISTFGLLLAITSGAVTSGMGYALWYSILPRLDATVAALAQLTVPVIAVVGGLILLEEPVGWRIVMACSIVLGGVAYGVIAGQRTRGSKGS